ncbi:minor capsid protein [Sphingobium limneticum]|uniref:Phage head morphogenesis protein n=1 Tax=Sphingobium limneticum TaxID=1007511 RepID=A0A5J5I627_9SPHN|nr:minor capsid protein [Sphingobium limneticum]KAA9018293.1 phage head morphogenesis protein [Sphingobium limneticum]KAA9030929.1 phage head morphogenesis protein [Sphingobium limneticum]
MSSVNGRLQDMAIRHAYDAQRYSRGLAAEIVDLLNSADQDLLDKLAVRLVRITERGLDTGPATTKRINQMLADLRVINSTVYKKVAASLTDELVEFAGVEAEFQASSLAKALPIQIATTVPAPALLRSLVTTSPMEGHLLKSWTDGMEVGRMQRIEAEIRMGMVAGESTDKIVQRLRGTRANGYADGILQKSRRSAQTVVRTATGHISNVAAQATWEANSNVVKGWQFLATFDSRTTVTCAGLSGQVFPIGKGPMPPRHPNCRSHSLPVTKSYREMGLDLDDVPPGDRASMDGQVAGDLRFDDWLTKKGDKMQDQILGPTRAQMFRDGKLKLADLIRDDGSVLTLEQLRKRLS